VTEELSTSPAYSCVVQSPMQSEVLRLVMTVQKKNVVDFRSRVETGNWTSFATSDSPCQIPF
jgi:hypothetical protein